MQLTRLVHEPLWISKVKAIHWPLSKVTHIQHFKTSFPKTTLGQLKPNFLLSLHGILGWKFVQMFRVTWPRWLPGSYMVKVWKKNPSSEPRSRWSWNLVYSFGYYQISSNEDTGLTLPSFIPQLKTLGWPCPFLWHSQICFVMLLHGWKLIEHIVIYFEGYSNSAYTMHSGERYRTVWSSGLYVFQLLRQCFNTLLIKSYISREVYRSSFPWH